MRGPTTAALPAPQKTVEYGRARQPRAASVHRLRQAHVARERQIVCFGGPSLGAGDAALNRYALSLVAKQRPRICLLVSARWDESEADVARFYRQFTDDLCQPSHFFPPRRGDEGRDLRAHLLRQDVIYVGGGSLIAVLSSWRLHEIDAVLRQAWRNGTALCGFGAGALCWFAEAVTSFDGRIRASRGLGLLPWSGCVRYGDSVARRETYRAHVLRGMRPGFAIEENVALRFVGAQPSAAVSSRSDGRAFKVEARNGELVETPLPMRYLGDRNTGASAELDRSSR